MDHLKLIARYPLPNMMVPGVFVLGAGGDDWVFGGGKSGFLAVE